MAASNFDAFLEFVWRPGFDAPLDGPHKTLHDTGGMTNGGVTQAVWDACCKVGMVKGQLIAAGPDQLTTVLRATCWEPVCQVVPAGVDLLIGNGRMMSGGFPHILQRSLGLMGQDVDGWIGPVTLTRIQLADPVTLIDAVSGSHYLYLTTLRTWPNFGAGWTKRLKAAQAEAIAMAVPLQRTK